MKALRRNPLLRGPLPVRPGRSRRRALFAVVQRLLHLDGDQRGADEDLLADLAVQLVPCGMQGRHLDRRLGGLDLGDGLVELDIVADLDEPLHRSAPVRPSPRSGSLKTFWLMIYSYSCNWSMVSRMRSTLGGNILHLRRR